jgi:glycosyltransferase involved in cell wall biosynthesis
MPELRILFLSHSPHWCGAERCLYHLVEGMRREGSVTVGIPGPGELNGRIAALGVKVVDVALRPWLVRSSHEAFRYQDFCSDLPERVEQLVDLIKRESIQVVYSNTSAIVDGALAARVAGVPHVWHFHELLGRNPEAIPFVDLPTFFNLIVPLTTRIAVVSKSVQAVVQDHVRSAPVEVVYNGIEVPPIVPAASSLPWTQATPEAPVVLYVGTLNYNKGLMSLVEAAPGILRRHPGARFYIVGQDHGYQQELEVRLGLLGVAHAFHFTGFCPNPLPLIAHASVLTLPSLADSLPVVVMEAMSVGTPVVATRSGGAAEMIVDRETGYLVPVRDADALAEALVRILDDPVRARDMGQRGRDRARIHFTPRAYFENFRRIFHETASVAVRPAGDDLVPQFLRTLDERLIDAFRIGLLQKQVDDLTAQVRDLQSEEIRHHPFLRAVRWLRRCLFGNNGQGGAKS